MFEFPVEKDKLYAAGIASGNYNTAKAQLLTVASGAIAERNIRYDKGEYSMIVRKTSIYCICKWFYTKDYNTFIGLSITEMQFNATHARFGMLLKY